MFSITKSSDSSTSTPVSSFPNSSSYSPSSSATLPSIYSSKSLQGIDFFQIVPEEHLRCARSKAILKKPMMLSCGDVFEEDSLSDWEKYNKKVCPKCFKPYTNKVEYLFAKTVLKRIQDKTSIDPILQNSLEDLCKIFPDIPEKEQIKCGIDLFHQGQIPEAIACVSSVMLNVINVEHAKLIAAILKNISSSAISPKKTLQPEKANSTPSTQQIQDRPAAMKDDEKSSSEEAASPVQGQKRPLNGGAESVSKRPKMTLKVPKPLSAPPTITLLAENPQPIVMQAEIVEELTLEAQPLVEDSKLIKMMKNSTKGSEVVNAINKNNANDCDREGNTPLHLLPMYYTHTTKLWEKLIKCKADINKQNLEGNTPLHIAAIKNKLTLIKDLRFKGVDTTIKNNKGLLAKDMTDNKDIKSWIERDMSAE